MQNATKTAIRAIVASDETIEKKTVEAIFKFLSGEAERPIGRILRTTEAARILGVTTKTLRLWAKAGALESVYVAGNRNRTGYTEASVRAIAAGQGKGAVA